MEERINALIIKSINLTQELREMKAEIAALQTKVGDGLELVINKSCCNIYDFDETDYVIRPNTILFITKIIEYIIESSDNIYFIIEIEKSRAIILDQLPYPPVCHLRKKLELTFDSLKGLSRKDTNTKLKLLLDYLKNY